MKIEQNKAAVPTDLKRQNRKQILEIFQNSLQEEISLNDIAQKSGISRATIAKAVNSFVQKELLLYRGKGNSTDVGGRKPDLYSFNKNYRFIAYLYIGIGYLDMSIMNLKLEEVIFEKIDIPVDTPIYEVVAVSKKYFTDLLEELKITESLLYGLCISTSGMVNQNTGILKYNLFYPSWGKNIPIRKAFEEQYPAHILIKIENIARASGQAEVYFQKELADKKILTIFTFLGISGCFIDKGVIQNSSNSLIGEIGHTIVEANDLQICKCGSFGCFENMVTEERILNRLRENSKKLKNSKLGTIDVVNLQDIFCAANEGDEYAQKLVEYAAKYFAIILRNVILTTDPDTIIFQGIYGRAGKFFQDSVTKQMGNNAYFPDDLCLDIRYDEGDIWMYAKIGMTLALTKELLNNEETK